MLHTQLTWSILWTVTTTVQRTDERAADITGNLNPLQINPYHTNGLIAIRVTAKNNLPLVAVRIYGAGANNAFPPAPTAVEAMLTTATDIAAGQGILRILGGRNRDSGAAEGSIITDQLRLIPEWLLLEYSTGAPGAAPTITFDVLACFTGPLPDGNE